MSLKTLLRRAVQVLLILIGLITLFLLFAIGPVDRTPAEGFDSYTQTMDRLDSLKDLSPKRPTKNFSVGFSKVNLTPDHRTATAGYGNRRGRMFASVHDSIFVRAIVVDNGATRAAIVSADLLIIPPLVTEQLAQKLQTIGFSLDNTFLGATHTHNSIGNWAEGATEFLYGDYDNAVVDFISDKIVESVRDASQNLLPSSLRTGTIADPQDVSNRLIDGGPEDTLLRSLEISRSDSSKLVLLSYTAHATCLYSRDLELSRDYPGVLVDTLEGNGYDFAMFMAGAVGSHRCSAPKMGWECVSEVGNNVAQKFLSSRKGLSEVEDSSILMIRVPFKLSKPQMKVTQGLKVRSWLFKAALGEFPAFLTALRIGDVVFLGTPCDFSGEFNFVIDSMATANNIKTFVTSFNGGYIGYVTPEKYYDVKHYETQLMNWYAPGTGEYMEHALEKLIIAVKD